MANRKIKDAKDLTSNELIYFRGHAKATYMSDGRTVEDAVNNMSGGSSADLSNYYTKTQVDTKLTEQQSKFIKVDGTTYLGDAEGGININGSTIDIFQGADTGVEISDVTGSEKIHLYSYENSLDVTPEDVTIQLGLGTSASSIIFTKNNITITNTNGTTKVGYKTLQTSTASSMTLTPNVYHRNTSTSLSTLTISLGAITDNTILNEYLVEFTTRSTGTTVNLPSSVKWVKGETPTFEAGSTYQISIVNNLGVVTQFK